MSKNSKNTKNLNQRFYSKEDIFLSRLASIIKKPKGTVHNMFCERAITTIRVNPLLGNPGRIKQLLEKKGLFLQRVDWSPDTYFVINKDKSELGKMNEYEKGLFYIQNLSSMLPVVELAPKPGEKVLDMCAAPGSKTSQMAVFMQNKGEIIANDEDAWRSQKLKEVLDLMGVKNTQIKILPGEEYGGKYFNYFDKVLLDAPCSGEGQVYLNSPKSLRFWSIKRVKGMSILQKKLIESAFRALKPGGTMIYSTCTLEPQENEEVVTHLLEKYNTAKLEQIETVKSDDYRAYTYLTKPGMKEWDQHKYNPEVAKTARIEPSAKMIGFYVAKIKKTA